MIANSYTALVTPFDEERRIDFDSLNNLIDWQLSESNFGLVLLGTTGERVTLSETEEELVLKTAVAKVNQTRPVVANTGCSNTLASVLRTQKAKDLGVDGALVVVPYYNCPPFRGIVKHYEMIAKVGLPIIAYHHPKRTGTRLSVDQWSEVCQIPNVVAIKEASSDLSYAKALVQAIRVPVLCGDDTLTLPMLQLGAKGTVSVISNLIPGQWEQIISCALNQQTDQAQRLYARTAHLIKALELDVNPVCIKYLLYLYNKCSPFVRLPLCEPSIDIADRLSAFCRLKTVA